MVKTISVGRYMSVQGKFIKALANGKILVRVGEKLFEGHPVRRTAS